MDYLSITGVLVHLSARAGVSVIPSGFQDVASMAPLPADPPIAGPVWTILIPAVLFGGSFLGTYFLYKRFSKAEAE